MRYKRKKTLERSWRKRKEKKERNLYLFAWGRLPY